MLSGDFISIFYPPWATGWFPEMFDCMIMSLPVEAGWQQVRSCVVSALSEAILSHKGGWLRWTVLGRVLCLYLQVLVKAYVMLIQWWIYYLEGLLGTADSASVFWGSIFKSNSNLRQFLTSSTFSSSPQPQASLMFAAFLHSLNGLWRCSKLYMTITSW